MYLAQPANGQHVDWTLVRLPVPNVASQEQHTAILTEAHKIGNLETPIYQTVMVLDHGRKWEPAYICKSSMSVCLLAEETLSGR